MLNTIEVWDNYYKDTVMRSGLIAWYGFKASDTVLEIYPENGALTLYLKDCCKQIYVLLRERTQYWDQLEKENKNVTCIDIEKLQLYENQFDYELVINAFPFWNDLASITEQLKVWKKYLKTSGTLLMAVNNLLSINKAIGIKNVYGKKEFGKNEITELLSNIYENVRIYNVFPDYIFPQVICADDCRCNQNVVERLIPYARNIYEIIQDEIPMYYSAAQNNILAQIAGSFLAECSDVDRPSKEDFITITSERGERGLITSLRREGEVIKKALPCYKKNQIEKIASNLNNLHDKGINVVPYYIRDDKLVMPYIKEHTLAELMSVLIEKKTDEFISLLDQLIQTVEKSSEPSKGIDEYWEQKYGRHNWGKILQRGYIEMTPLNCFYVEKEIVFFDQEYIMNNCPLNYIIYRCLAHLYSLNSKYEKCIPIEYFKDKYKLKDSWEIYEQAERDFLHSIRTDKHTRNFEKYLCLYNRWQYDLLGNVQVDRDIRRLLRNIEDKEIAVIGVGKYYDLFMQQFGSLLQVDILVSNEPKQIGKIVNGKKIYSLDYLKNKNVVVFVCVKEYEKICKELNEISCDYRIYSPEVW